MADTGKLGTVDSLLGDVLLAYAGAPDTPPSTGSETGKLGTVDSLLGGVRLGLSEVEGGGGGSIIEAAATSTLSLSDEALVAISRACAAENTLVLSVAAGRNNLPAVDAESTISLTVEAASTISRGVAAESAIALTDAAGRNNLPSLSAESVLGLETAAGFTVARAVVAESTLALTQSADGTGRNIIFAAAESSLSLDTAAAFKAAWAVAATNTLDLTDAAGRNNLPSLSAESIISLTDAAGRNNFLTASADSTLVLTDAAGRNNFLAASAESTLAVTDAASAIHARAGVAESSLSELTCVAVVHVARSLSAQSTILLSHAEHTARPWYLSAETPLQTTTEAYDQATDTFYPVYEGLQDSAGATRPVMLAVHHPIPLSQSASAVRVKPTAIAVSAESVLELLGEVRVSPTGGAGNWLTLHQAAAVDRCKLVRSALDLTQTAAVLVSVPRGAASALGLTQAATYSIVSRGSLQQYTPFVGEGPGGAPTPPSVTLGPPEHVALPFQLFYPAEGVVTDSLTLRAPNLGNKDRLSFNRILRETRGGTLIVFADPIWPKIQTLVLTFSGLRSVQTQQLLAFLETHLGEEIGLLDWEGRAWKGIVTSPTEPVVQDGKDSFSANLEFEGELVPA